MKKIIVVLVLLLPICLMFCSCRSSGPEEIVTEDLFLIEKGSQDDALDEIVASLMEKYKIPGLSLAIINQVGLPEARTYGIIQRGQTEKVNKESMFSVGSISKVVNSILIMSLVDDGLLDLDTDISKYLSKWELPRNGYDKAITVRTILSHTAGLSVHGFADYEPGEALPTTREILEGSGPAKNDKVEAIFAAGSKFKYSGGGITVTQMIIEELTGLPYHQTASKYLFDELGLGRTTYQNPLPERFSNIAKAHNGSGEAVALPVGYQSMPEAAASGLWTTPTDLAILLQATFLSTDASKLLFSTSLLEDMISAEENSAFGLGPKLEEREDGLVIFHNGANDSYRAHFKIFWRKKSGFVVFTNGSNGLDLINELNPFMDDYFTKL